MGSPIKLSQGVANGSCQRVQDHFPLEVTLWWVPIPRRVEDFPLESDHVGAPEGIPKSSVNIPTSDMS